MDTFVKWATMRAIDLAASLTNLGGCCHDLWPSRVKDDEFLQRSLDAREVCRAVLLKSCFDLALSGTKKNSGPHKMSRL